MKKKKKKVKMQACVLNVFYEAILIPSIIVNDYIKLFKSIKAIYRTIAMRA